MTTTATLDRDSLLPTNSPDEPKTLSARPSPRAGHDVAKRPHRAECGCAQEIDFRSEFPKQSAQQRAEADDDVANQIVRANGPPAEFPAGIFNDERFAGRVPELLEAAH